jgi:hypothetical protein
MALLAACATMALGQQEDFVSGTYRLKVSDDVASIAQTMGQPAPDGSLLLGPNHGFELIYRTVAESSHRFGTYYVDGNDITFRFRNRMREFHGTIRGGSIYMNGLEYRRPGWNPPVSTPALPVTPSAVFSPDPHPPVLYSAPAVPAPPPVVVPPFNPVGTWTVHANGVEDAASRMSFDRDGNFTFSGKGARSKGHYTVHDEVISLVWTQIDDDPVDEGTVKKDFPICADHLGFNIDTYHYERCSK